MAQDARIFRINYKSDFILTLESDAGWMTPFCIKFWTGAPSQAYYVSWDGETYNHCSFDPSEPTKLLVQFDDHHLPIGDLKYQVAYHFTVADFPNDTEDEVLNQANITTEIDGQTYQVMLDFTGETAPEIQFSLPAYANEAQRIANEQHRIVNETQRISNEETRIQHEQQRIAQEQTRQQNEQQRINQEQARVDEYAGLKADAVAATGAANDAAALANQKAQLADDKAALAQDAADLANAKAQLAADKAALAASAAQLANDKAALAQQKAEYAQTQGDYAKAQGDYAKDQGDTALADHQRAEADHGIAVDDHTQAGNDHTRAESDHGIAVDDHTQAGNDHTRAESDHGIAADDHTQAGNDHTRAESDHGIAADDHTQAGNDHTRAESDHTRAESDHDAVELYVDSLGVFDLSKHNAVGGVLATYADLSAALTALNALESKYKYGGMSFKYVQTSDNKYVQYRLMLSTFTAATFTNVANWQGVDEKPTDGSKNFVESGGIKNEIDKKSFVLSFIGANNTFVYGLPCHGFIGGHIYRFYIVDQNWDISGVTVSDSLTKFTIEGSYDNNNYTNIYNPYITTLIDTTRASYDWLCPSSVSDNNTPQWSVRIAGRATEGVEVFVVAEDVTNDLLECERNIVSAYPLIGEDRKVKYWLKFNLKKGRTYEISADGTSQGTSNTIASVQIKDVNDNIVFIAGDVKGNAIKKASFTADNDYYGCWIRSYIDTAGIDVSITYSITDVTEEYNKLAISQDTSTGITSFTQYGETVNITPQIPARTANAPIFASSKDTYKFINTLDIRYFDIVQGSIYNGAISDSNDYIRTNLPVPLYGDGYLNISHTKTRSDGGKWQFRGATYKSDGTVRRKFNSWKDVGTSEDYRTWASDSAYIMLCFRLMIPDPDNEGQWIQTPATPNSLSVGELMVETNTGAIVDAIERLRSADNNALKKDGTDVLTQVQKAAISNEIGLGGGFEKTFTITSGAFTLDQIAIDVKKGHTYTAGLYSSNGTLVGDIIHFYDKDGNRYDGMSLANNETKIGVCPCDAVYVDIYIRGGSSGTFTFKIVAGMQYDLDNYVAPTITNLNKEAIDYIRTAKTKFNGSSYGSDSYGQYISILQMTDTHWTNNSIKRCFEFGEIPEVDIVIHTGDITERGREEIDSFWEDSVLSSSKVVLGIPGNHEFAHNALTDDEIYNWLYNANLQAHNGEIHAVVNSTSKNYFYKDITKNGFTIRIIALYQFEWDVPRDGEGTPLYLNFNGKGNSVFSQEQVDWFVQLLKDTPSSYGLVILSHGVIATSKYANDEINRPSDRDTEFSDGLMRWGSNKYFFYDILKAWKDGGACQTTTTQTTPDDVEHIVSVDTTFDGGGKFVANICGHEHQGGMLMMVDRNGNKSSFRVVMSPCTTYKDVQNTGWWGRSDIADSKLMDCLNVITYDNDMDKVRVVRVGSAITNELKECKTFVF